MPPFSAPIPPPISSNAIKNDYAVYGRKAGIIAGVTIGLFAACYLIFRLRDWGRWRIGRAEDASRPYRATRWVRTWRGWRVQAEQPLPQFPQADNWEFRLSRSQPSFIACSRSWMSRQLLRLKSAGDGIRAAGSRARQPAVPAQMPESIPSCIPMCIPSESSNHRSDYLHLHLSSGDWAAGLRERESTSHSNAHSRWGSRGRGLLRYTRQSRHSEAGRMFWHRCQPILSELEAAPQIKSAIRAFSAPLTRWDNWTRSTSSSYSINLGELQRLGAVIQAVDIDLESFPFRGSEDQPPSAGTSIKNGSKAGTFDGSVYSSSTVGSDARGGLSSYSDSTGPLSRADSGAGGGKEWCMRGALPRMRSHIEEDPQQESELK